MKDIRNSRNAGAYLTRKDSSKISRSKWRPNFSVSSKLKFAPSLKDWKEIPQDIFSRVFALILS